MNFKIFPPFLAHYSNSYLAGKCVIFASILVGIILFLSFCFFILLLNRKVITKLVILAANCPRVSTTVLQVVEFSSRGYKIRKIFA